jgi:hypothetical protein
MLAIGGVRAMTDREIDTITIQITLEQRQKISQLAQRQGYEAIDDYLRSLIEADAQAQGEMLDLDHYDAELAFEEAWQDVVNGNTYPVATLWDDLDDDSSSAS